MRTRNSIRNISIAIVGQVISIGFNFINRTIFIKILGEYILGINGLCINIISVLSLAELGISSAIIYSLYEPLANNNYKKINALVGFYKKAYMLIGSIILVVGLMVTPFIKVFVEDSRNINLELIFILFLINTVITYFCSYRRTLILADQKGYIDSIFKYSFFSVLNIVQIIVLILTQNYILYLGIQIIFGLIENLSIGKYIKALYPWLDEKGSLEKREKKQLYKNVKALLMHKIGAVLVLSTDNMIISYFVGVVWVGLYSNYILIINAINSILGQIFVALTASIGNLAVKETTEKSFKIYKVVNLINYWIVFVCSICLFTNINDFISIWIGEKYILETEIIIVIILNFYFTGMRKSVGVYKDAYGLFYQDRYKAIAEGIINLIISIVLAIELGLIGILLGTLISTLMTCFWIEPYVLFKYGFKMKLLDYMKDYMKKTLIWILSMIFIFNIGEKFIIKSFSEVVIKSIITFGVTNIIIIILFSKTQEFKVVKSKFVMISKRIITKIRRGENN